MSGARSGFSRSRSQHIRRHIGLAPLHRLDHDIAEALARIAAQHDEAPRLELAVIRRAHRGAENLGKGFVIGRRLGELGRAAAGGQGVDCIHRGTVRISVPL